MKTEPLVTFERRDRLALISLHRPERHNALVPGPEKDVGSVGRTRKSLRANSAVLRQRLETERENFVSQIQTQTALDGIDLFLRRREHV